MTIRVVPCVAPAAKPLALALAVSLTFAASAAFADEADVPTVVVSGARFPADPALAPIGSTVITADEIRRAGSADVNEAIRKIGGVFGRQSLDGSPDFALDLRGFGSNSSQNLVVMVDGVRLSENELSGAVLSTIPVDSVERIEITRGGSSVLYGDGATGGVIAIFTKSGAARGVHGSVLASYGQFEARDLRANLSAGIGQWALDGSIGNQDTDNYRANNRFKQTNFNGGAAYSYDGGRAGIRVDSARQDSRLPGSLTEAQFQADPRQSKTPHDFGSLDSDRVTAFVEHHLGATEIAAELSHREKTVKAAYEYNYGSGPFYSRSKYDSRQTQFSPRMRNLSDIDGMRNELVAGADLIRWNRKTTADFSLADASQDSKAIYVRDELRWDAAHNGRVAAGARHEVFDKDYVDPLGMSTAPEHSVQSQNAWDLQASYDVAPGLGLHAKAGQSYRLPNADENSYRSSIGVLNAQTSHDLELGATLGGAVNNVAVRVFRHRLRNEIFFDPTINGWGANTNLDPTRRQGVEIDGQAALAQDWRISGHLQHVDASFTAGPNAGREMVLVPRNTLSARLAWVPGNGQSADVGAQWVSSQRYGNDFSNSCGARIPSYATLDARYARQLGPWELAVAGNNLTDRQYYSNAFGCKSGIYPSDGRQLKLSARYAF
ncbi:TonB-dependent receptor [Massilia terrae]|uniref:TonB-dependent receptor n=1 Tax=Massilia terrae TaxID=1811224 RepID=A0ABT2CYS0_9BURK|nr:TonB-dependent receptor [Massilia terrae]MCS0659126.1 TonB-dependent receptor [Massilia terrae]